MKHVKILGISIAALKSDQLIEQVIEQLSKQSTYRIVQLNPEIAVDTVKNPAHKSLIDSADVVVANGVGIQWAALYQRNPGFENLLQKLGWIVMHPERMNAVLPERITSSNFTWPLLETLPEKTTVLIAGSPKDSNIKTTRSFLENSFPHLNFTSFDASNYDEKTQTLLVEKAKESSPDIILLGIGFPAQEKAAITLASELENGVIITEGGTFDYEQFGGQIKRAPKTIQKIGLEWLWRLFREPRRIGRQLKLVQFVRLIHKKSRKAH